QSALLSSLAYTFAIRPPHAPTLFPYTTLFRSPLLEYDLPDRCDLVQYLIALHLLQRRDHFVPCLLLGKLIIMGFQCLILRPVAALFKAADQPDQRALQQWMIPPPASLSAMSYNTMKVPDRKPLPQK